MSTYKIKTVFQVRPDENSDKILAEFENEEVITNDEHDHNGWFGEGHHKAKAYVNEHGGVIIRKVFMETTRYDTYSGNLYYPYKGESF